MSFFPGAGDVRVSLNGTIYQNNSIVTLEDIGKGDDALLCITDLTDCCRPPYTNYAIGNWFFPNGTRVPGAGQQWDFHRTRGWRAVYLHRRRGEEEGIGIYRCEIPVPQSDAENVMQTIYIGVYNASTGKTPLINSCNQEMTCLIPLQTPIWKCTHTLALSYAWFMIYVHHQQNSHPGGLSQFV